MLQIGGEFRFINAVIGRSLDLTDGIAGERQRFGHGQPSAIRADGVHQITRFIIDIKHGPLQQRSGRQSVGGVVVGRLLDNLDLACDGPVFPGDFRGLARLYIDGFQLFVYDIALVLQLPQIHLAGQLQGVNVGVSVLIGGELIHGIHIAVVEEEGHTIDSLSGGGVDFV